MFKMNNKMQLVLNRIKSIDKDDVNIKQLKELLFPKIKNIHGCFVIDNEDEMNENEIKYNFIKKMFGNRTMYEIGCNEICINFYVESNDNLQVANVGYSVMEVWKYRLKSEYPKDSFCIVMEVSDNHTILRFYKVREDEGLVIGNNIESTTQIAIGIEVI